MKPVWQLATTQTFNLGWDQMILLEGRPGTHVKLVYRDVCLTGESDWNDEARVS
jgi:hypothetical protein